MGEGGHFPRQRTVPCGTDGGLYVPIESRCRACLVVVTVPVMTRKESDCYCLLRLLSAEPASNRPLRNHIVIIIFLMSIIFLFLKDFVKGRSDWIWI